MHSADARTVTGRRYYRVVISREKRRWLPSLSVTAAMLPVSDGARRVLAQAFEEASRLFHNYVGTEHILLGLLHDCDSTAVGVLRSLGVVPEAVREQVEEIIGVGTRVAGVLIGFAEASPLTPRARKVLELARHEAVRSGDRAVGTEHVLLGLIAEGEGVAAQVLVRMGADLRRVRRFVLDGHDIGERGARNTSVAGW